MIILPWIVEAIMRQEALERSSHMGKHQQEYIHNVARTIMGQIGGVPCKYSGGISESDTADYPDKLWMQHGIKVTFILNKMSPAVRGKIAACGGTSCTAPTNCSLYAITNVRQLGTRMDTGSEILTMLAAYVVVAAMVDIIRAQAQLQRDADPLAPSEELTTGLRPYIDEAHHSAIRH